MITTAKKATGVSIEGITDTMIDIVPTETTENTTNAVITEIDTGTTIDITNATIMAIDDITTLVVETLGIGTMFVTTRSAMA